VPNVLTTDTLDELDVDIHPEDTHDREASDEREPNSKRGAIFREIDQRDCIMIAAFMANRVNVDAFPLR
jgi:hypothetical protein